MPPADAILPPSSPVLSAFLSPPPSHSLHHPPVPSSLFPALPLLTSYLTSSLLLLLLASGRTHRMPCVLRDCSAAAARRPPSAFPAPPCIPFTFAESTQQVECGTKEMTPPCLICLRAISLGCGCGQRAPGGTLWRSRTRTKTPPRRFWCVSRFSTAEHWDSPMRLKMLTPALLSDSDAPTGVRAGCSRTPVAATGSAQPFPSRFSTHPAVFQPFQAGGPPSAPWPSRAFFGGLALAFH